MAHIVTDLLELYKTYFQGSYTIPPKTETDFSGTRFDAAYREQYRGVEVFLPVRLTNTDYEVYIPCATLRVTGQKTVVRTPVAERIGTVKEVLNIGDYKFDIKGVLIAENANAYPDDEVYRLRMLFESATPVRLINAVGDLTDTCTITLPLAPFTRQTQPDTLLADAIAHTAPTFIFKRLTR